MLLLASIEPRLAKPNNGVLDAEVELELLPVPPTSAGGRLVVVYRAGETQTWHAPAEQHF